MEWKHPKNVAFKNLSEVHFFEIVIVDAQGENHNWRVLFSIIKKKISNNKVLCAKSQMANSHK